MDRTSFKVKSLDFKNCNIFYDILRLLYSQVLLSANFDDNCIDSRHVLPDQGDDDQGAVLAVGVHALFCSVRRLCHCSHRHGENVRPKELHCYLWFCAFVISKRKFRKIRC
jgi:hypothetical protein